MDRSEFISIIKPLFLKEINYDLNENQVDKFFIFMNYLIEENSKFNLTTIVDPVQIIYKHFLDSCQLIVFPDFNFNGKAFIDIGCGAGFPSIPIAILTSDSSFVLVDSVKKKLNFIDRLIGLIDLTNISTKHIRIEDLGHDNSYIENFDYCLSRALSNISVVLEYSSSLIKIGGSVFIYKMKDSLTELSNSKNAQKVLFMKHHSNYDYNICSSEPTRTIYSFIKEKHTLSQYPRKAGIPSKKPL